MARLSICTPVAIYMQFSDLGHLLSDAVCPKLNINIHIHNDKNYSTTKSCMEISVGNASLFVVFFFSSSFPIAFCHASLFAVIRSQNAEKEKA